MSSHTHLEKRIVNSVALALYDNEYSMLSIIERKDVDWFVRKYIMPHIGPYIERNYERKENT